MTLEVVTFWALAVLLIGSALAVVQIGRAHV